MHITVCGLRGGVGTTSMVAMLADALNILGESVLVIDLNPSDLLRLHFNIPYADQQGWACAQAQGSDLQQHSYQVKDNLYVLPYGRHGVAGLDQDINGFDIDISEWVQHDLAAASGCSWVIFDLPHYDPRYQALRARSQLDFLVTNADAASHILLGQYPLTPQTKILVNDLDVRQRLSDAVLLDWSIRYAAHLVPVRVRQDLHVQEAFAYKMPATTYFPNASSVADVFSLATWCLVQRGVVR